MSHLELKNVSKSFGPVGVLHHVDIEVKDREFVVFVGPSGCGKSTLLRIIAGLEKATSGDVVLDGEVVNHLAAADRGLAMVFQSYALYPHMSVRQNLSFGLENTKTPRDKIEARVTEIARMLRIEELLERKPRQLSGGQRQRVAIGRAMVRRPGVFLLDEPLSNLDAELRVTMRAELAALHKRLDATMIYVTHDQTEAMTLADRIVVLRDGRVEQIGTPLELYNRPANRFVAGFIGAPHMNFLEGRFAGGEAGAARIELDGGHMLSLHIPARPKGEPITIGVRPHHIETQGGQARIPATVTLVEALGPETIIHAEAEGQPRIVAALAGQRGITSGDTVSLALDERFLHAFDADGRRVAEGEVAEEM
ncbi:ABC transporter ATP-binding protein [Chelativorans xinjiangense]|uniref:ABC transporter ATP-binding protein n=1 Tax=Chelativorans xinjiangense TaxID=2681485 RepID=UPI0013589F2B|nr:sn-glycerol-3-phosphate ABC transporter ATP-binding protein UgpC [Chelativorans xinjiangense]